MTKSPEFRADRLAWRFEKSGGDGEWTRIFANLDERISVRLLSLACVDQSEVPAIGHFRSSEEWMVITDQRVVWSSHSDKQSLQLSDIEEATIESETLRAAGDKSHVERLILVTRENQAHTLLVERGKPFSGVWNALKMAATWFE